MVLATSVKRVGGSSDWCLVAPPNDVRRQGVSGLLFALYHSARRYHHLVGAQLRGRSGAPQLAVVDPAQDLRDGTDILEGIEAKVEEFVGCGSGFSLRKSIVRSQVFKWRGNSYLRLKSGFTCFYAALLIWPVSNA